MERHNLSIAGIKSDQLTQEIIAECKARLLAMKADLFNRARVALQQLSSVDRAGGDEIDQLSVHQQETDLMNAQDRINQTLLEIELALARIATGKFGICEETDEPIENQRLRTLPYTRLSIEGAELREALKNKYAK
jgi:DnaK suppressor protein